MAATITAGRVHAGIAAALAFTVLAAGQSNASPQEVRPPRQIKALTSGSCPTVSDGDTLTLDWNPGFDNASEVTGLAEVILYFATAAESQQGGRAPRGGVTLKAMPRGEGGSHFTALGNGYYQVTFHVHVNRDKAGEYRLVRSEITPAVGPEHQGALPKMTNTPASLPFCLTVTAPSSNGS